MRRLVLSIIVILFTHVVVFSATPVHVDNPETWTYSQLQAYVGQTIEFDVPFYVCNNYNGITISPRRVFQPTNQALPLSKEYSTLLTLNSQATLTLTGVSGYRRLGERLHKLVVKVNSTKSVSLVSCEWRGNTREDLEKGYDEASVNMRGEASLVVCCMNLEYYMAENTGSGSMGPKTKEAHQKQRAKVSKALAKIDADVYGFVEIEQGQQALAEIAADLTANTGRKFTYINDGGAANGTYTKAGYVYCTDMVEPYGRLRENNTGVTNRKKTQAFVEKATGERFLFSVNHFKAKSGNGSGDNADKKDGQGSYNGDRVREAQSLLLNYDKDRLYYDDDDMLIMGDLNAYAMEDPITCLRKGGMIDLHRAFHADSSYSYVYHGYAGYLDHALCNNTLFPHVTGMVAYHINSDESDSYTYDKSNDQTMFRSSDHDPVIVGLNLTETYSTPPQDGDESGVEDIVRVRVELIDGTPYICNADGGQCRIYSMDGNLVRITDISTELEPITNLKHGLYILNIYGQGSCLQTKLMLK